MIANDVFTACFGIVPAGDEEHLTQVARAAVRNGFALVVNVPGDKKPLCTLTARQAKNEDRVVQERAREAGDQYWDRRRHACSINHALTDEATATRVVRRLVTERGHINFGVEVGRSNMLVIDVDTAAQRTAFLAEWSQETGRDMSDHMPTVLSPGKVKVAVDGDQKWIHKDGGHYWFSLPEGVSLRDLPGTGVLVGEGGWAAIWRDHQVIVPPSVRPEGAYQLVGQVEPAPRWLVDRIQFMAHAYAERREAQKNRTRYADDPIDAWSAGTRWSDLLESDGWTDTGLPDTCDCLIWTRPGDASHFKSATAHELGCTRYDMSTGHGPLYLWTDNPPEFLADAVRATGKRAVTKLQYVAWRDHAGEMRPAMDAIGLATMHDDEPFDPWSEPFEATTPRSEPAPTPSPTSQPVSSAATVLETEAALPVDQPDTDQVDLLAEANWEGAAEREEFVKLLNTSGLPPAVRIMVDTRWVKEYADEQYRQLRNKTSIDDMRQRMHDASDRLDRYEIDENDDPWRFAGLWMQGQTIMLTARWKAGKTTMVLNVVRSLVDGAPFLGQFEVTPVTEGCVAVVNAEMTRRQFMRWLAVDGPQIDNRDRVCAFHVREAGPQSGDIVDPTRRTLLVEWLIEHQARVLILDPLNPMLSASGIEENSSSEVAQWFNALADIRERVKTAVGWDLDIMLVHHFGHAGQRGRGSSKFMDAPDALWTYTVDDEDVEESADEDDLLGSVEPPSAPRYLSAVGRDVELSKRLVTFDKTTKTLTVDGSPAPVGKKAQAEQRRRRSIAVLTRRVVREVQDSPGITSNALFTQIGGNKAEFQAARDEALRTNQVVKVDGKNRSMCLFPPEFTDPGGTGETK